MSDFDLLKEKNNGVPTTESKNATSTSMDIKKDKLTFNNEEESEDSNEDGDDDDDDNDGDDQNQDQESHLNKQILQEHKRLANFTHHSRWAFCLFVCLLNLLAIFE
jgi:hypothetical protein